MEEDEKMKLKVTVAALVAALDECRGAAPAPARQKGDDPVWMVASEEGASLRWGSWGNPPRPRGETRIRGAHPVEPGAFPLLETRGLLARIRKTFRGMEGEGEIADGEFHLSGVGERAAARGRINEAEAPRGPGEVPPAAIRFGADSFAATARAVTPFASRDDYRPLLKRVEVSHRRGVCRMTATDTYRLGTARLDAEPEGISAPFSRTLPAQLVKTLGAVAERTGGEAELRWSEEEGGRKEGAAGSTRLWLPRDGDERCGRSAYPDWRALYSKEKAPSASGVLFDASGTAANILSLVAEYPGEKDLPVRLWLHESGKVEAAPHSNSREYERIQVGEGKVRAPYNGCFNPRFLDEALRSVPPKRVRLSYSPSDNGEAARGPLYLENGDFRHLLMAVRI